MGQSLPERIRTNRQEPKLLQRSEHPPDTLNKRCRSTTLPPAEAIANLENSLSILPKRLSTLRVKIAVAKVKPHFHAPHGHKLFHSNSNNSFPEKPVGVEQKKISCSF